MSFYILELLLEKDSVEDKTYGDELYDIANRSPKTHLNFYKGIS